MTVEAGTISHASHKADSRGLVDSENKMNAEHPQGTRG
jgi:hypothetical protein